MIYWSGSTCGKLRFPDDYLFDQIHCEHSGGPLLDSIGSVQSADCANSPSNADKDSIDSAGSVDQISE